MTLHTLIVFLTLLVCAAARAVPGYNSSSDAANHLISLFESKHSLVNYTKVPLANISLGSADHTVLDTAADDDDDPPTTDELWCKYTSRGMSLGKAMMMDENDARTLLGWPYVQSPWDGDMKTDMETWGYLDTEELHRNHDADCDFASKHQLATMFNDDELKVDVRSSGQGGPNHCFYIMHADSPAIIRDQDNNIPEVKDQRYWVGSREYRATDAHAGIGVNPTDGFLYFMDRQSPEEGAKETWGRPATPQELPALRSSSDLAFAFWNRVATTATRSNVKYIMSCQITNDETEAIIERALEAVNVDGIQKWPGTDFDFAFGPDQGDEIEAALALLGSPNGLGAGYFLIQHRRQLGWKYISKVKVFESDDNYPYILFYVSDHAPWAGPIDSVEQQLETSRSAARQKRDRSKTKAYKRAVASERKSRKGKRVLLEHPIEAKP